MACAIEVVSHADRMFDFIVRSFPYHEGYPRRDHLIRRTDFTDRRQGIKDITECLTSVSPSTFEPFGLVPLEAELLAGRIPIVTATGGHLENFRNINTYKPEITGNRSSPAGAIFVPGINPRNSISNAANAVCHALTVLLKMDPQQYAEIVNIARSAAREGWMSITPCAQEYVKVYEKAKGIRARA